MRNAYLCTWSKLLLTIENKHVGKDILILVVKAGLYNCVISKYWVASQTSEKQTLGVGKVFIPRV